MTETVYNAMPNPRDCPRCFRKGSLSGDRNRREVFLECSGCAAIFRVEPAIEDGMPDTLRRVSAPAPLRMLPPWAR